jgi:chromosome partitioning protein
MTDRIAISNQKGGTGKTTVTVNLAGAFNEIGRDVLVVDLDPQGALTEVCGFADAYDAQPPSLYDVLAEQKRDELPALILEHEELDLIPSNIDMTAAESELILARRGGEQLALALEGVADDYDIVLVDCPPHLGLLTDNALFATRSILIPALAEGTSKRALELLYDHVESLELDYDVTIEERGLIANRVEPTNEAEEMLAWFDEAMGDLPIWKIRKRVDLQRAMSRGGSIFQYKPGLDMADVFLSIAQELDAGSGKVETWGEPA